jgi:hypothetical protein
VSGLCPIVIWLSLVSVRSCRVSVRLSLGSTRSLSDRSGLCPIVIWLSLVSVRSCRISVRSSFGSAWSLSDRVGSLSDRHLAQPDLCLIGRVSVRSSFGSAWSLSDRLFAQPLSSCGVVCRWPDSFCDLLFGLSFVVDLSRGLPSTILGFRCGF